MIMNERMPGKVMYSVHALNQGLRGAPLMGIEEARNYQRAIGADGGLQVPPIRSRLVQEISKEARRGSYQNVEEDMPLVGSLQHSFAPTIGEAFRRQYERASIHELSLAQAFVRFGKNVGQRMLMPAAANASKHMERLAMNIADPNLFAVMPPEAFMVTQGERISAGGYSTPYQRVAQVSPDLLERLEVKDMGELPEALEQVGIEAASLDLFHLSRRSQTGNTQLPPFREWLGAFVQQVPVRQIGVSINRFNELPPATGEAAGAETMRLGTALLRYEPERGVGNDLPDLLSAVRAIQPELPLTVMVIGNLGHFSVGQMTTVLGNVKEVTNGRPWTIAQSRGLWRYAAPYG
jgi:hypothetical protein